MPDRWLLNSFQQYAPPGGFGTIITTDVACHLWLRWSRNRFRTHPRVKVVRGLRLMGDVYYCFTAYSDVEQEEAGDTLTHTFIVTPWPVCETRWFYFWGQIGGVDSPSQSPIFEFHMPSITTPDLYEAYTLNWDSRQSIYGNIWRGQSFTPQEKHILSELWFLMSRGVPAWASLYFRLYAAPDDTPIDPILAWGSRIPANLTPHLHGAWADIYPTPYVLEPGVKYALVLYSNASSAARLFWHGDVTAATYPRGLGLVSTTAGASWDKLANADNMFYELGYPFF